MLHKETIVTHLAPGLCNRLATEGTYEQLKTTLAQTLDPTQPLSAWFDSLQPLAASGTLYCARPDENRVHTAAPRKYKRLIGTAQRAWLEATRSAWNALSAALTEAVPDGKIASLFTALQSFDDMQNEVSRSRYPGRPELSHMVSSIVARPNLERCWWLCERLEFTQDKVKTLMVENFGSTYKAAQKSLLGTGHDDLVESMGNLLVALLEGGPNPIVIPDEQNVAAASSATIQAP
ncbi:hypothetical protein Q5752_003403 [Cryptotrichosporon argae]